MHKILSYLRPGWRSAPTSSMLTLICVILACAVLISYAVSNLDALKPIEVCIFACAVGSKNSGWVIYLRQCKKRQTVFYGPVDCWIGILTRFPLLVLVSGVSVPAAIGFYGLQQCGFSPPINMDFASYLAVDLRIQVTYDCVQELSGNW